MPAPTKRSSCGAVRWMSASSRLTSVRRGSSRAAMYSSGVIAELSPQIEEPGLRRAPWWQILGLVALRAHRAEAVRAVDRLAAGGPERHLRVAAAIGAGG